jgi:hypothetical protein
MATAIMPSATIQPDPATPLTPPLCLSLQGPSAYQLPRWHNSTFHAASSTDQSASSVSSVDASTQSNTSTMNTSPMMDPASSYDANTVYDSTAIHNTAFISPPLSIHPSISTDTSSSTHPNWNLPVLSHHFWHVWQRIDQGPLKFIVVPVKWLVRHIKASVSFDMITMIVSLALVVVFGYPAWKALNLQDWTSRKDVLEHCSDESVCTR